MRGAADVQAGAVLRGGGAGGGAGGCACRSRRVGLRRRRPCRGGGGGGLVSGGAAAADCPGLVGIYALAAHTTGRNRHAVRPPAYWQSAVDRHAPPVGAPAALLSQGRRSRMGVGTRQVSRGRGGGQVADAGGRHAPGRVCYAVSQSKSSWARPRRTGVLLQELGAGLRPIRPALFSPIVPSSNAEHRVFTPGNGARPQTRTSQLST